MNSLNPKKLLLSKWTAVTPVKKQKHFLVSRVIQPELPTDPIEMVEIESVFSKATQIIAWRQLQDDKVWRQGWVWSGTSVVMLERHYSKLTATMAAEQLAWGVVRNVNAELTIFALNLDYKIYDGELTCELLEHLKTLA